ncbi:MAG: hypothetical protein HQK98_02480 [Nitrospirae bacterium]|nr:hypothetical protein [Nitrospirota bacterium]
MANLSTVDKRVLEDIFKMGTGRVLNFTNQSMGDFFIDDVNVDIYAEKYEYSTNSKANRMKGFWRVADDSLVGKSIMQLIGYIEHQISVGALQRYKFPQDLIDEGKEIANRLLGKQPVKEPVIEDESLKKSLKKYRLTH